MVERCLGKAEVVSSNLISCSSLVFRCILAEGPFFMVIYDKQKKEGVT